MEVCNFFLLMIYHIETNGMCGIYLIENCTFDTSVAKGLNGGAISAEVTSGTNFSLSYLIFKNCTVSGDNGKGGGIYLTVNDNFGTFYLNV
jgi:hypothetical protein